MQPPSDRRRPSGPRRATTGERLTAAVTAAVSLAILVVASTLAPDPRGHGTHEQLGLSPCGWAVVTGWPCATCGMTTSFASAATGSWLGSLRAQPMGTLLVAATGATFWGGLHVAVFGSRIGAVCATLIRGRVFGVAAVAWVLAWAYKAATWNP